MPAAPRPCSTRPRRVARAPAPTTELNAAETQGRYRPAGCPERKDHIRLGAAAGRLVSSPPDRLGKKGLPGRVPPAIAEPHHLPRPIALPKVRLPLDERPR